MVGKMSPQELIGEEIIIVAAKNKSNLGLQGIIVDETKSLIKVQVKNSIKALLKKTITFKIIRSGEVVEGNDLLKRPEDRIKG